MKVYREIIDDNYLLIIKNYNNNKNNKNYYFLNDIKNYENNSIYINNIFNIKRKLQYYEILIHNYCIRKYIDIYKKWEIILVNYYKCKF
tara:strand:- start:4485 stop:4751 length:267 start_codon:yes stop_codon:yes gene_type:complete